MEAFHTQLTAARKKKGLTQEQLAELMNVSRPTVSRWENGHVLPDVDTVRRLIELLDFDFLNGHALTDAQKTPQQTLQPANEAPNEAHAETAKPKNHRILPVLLLCAALVCLIAICLALRGSHSKNEPPIGSMVLISGMKEKTEGIPCVVIHSEEDPVKAVYSEAFGNGAGWHYTFRITETNGVPLTVTRMYSSLFLSNGKTNKIELSEDYITSTFMGSNILHSGYIYHFQGGFPLQSLVAVGLTIEGLAPDGTPLHFNGHVNFSKEFAE